MCTRKIGLASSLRALTTCSLTFYTSFSSLLLAISTILSHFVKRHGAFDTRIFFLDWLHAPIHFESYNYSFSFLHPTNCFLTEARKFHTTQTANRKLQQQNTDKLKRWKSPCSPHYFHFYAIPTQPRGPQSGPWLIKVIVTCLVSFRPPFKMMSWLLFTRLHVTAKRGRGDRSYVCSPVLNYFAFEDAKKIPV